jgi:hypothetical protein
LQQNSDSVKVENEVDVVSEGDSTDMKSNDEAYTPLLTFSIQKAEPEVGHVSFLTLYWLLVFLCMRDCVCERERERGVIRYNFS